MSMEEMFAEARKTGKWFYCSYQSLWWSPDRLAAEQAAGRFRWSPDNFQLRDPQEYLAQARSRTQAAQAEERRVAEIIALG